VVLSYTPLMAKRFNVSIPDALAERLEPHKDRISLSAVMQAALERELAQLNLSDEDKQRRASLKAVATEAWLKRNPYIGKALASFIDALLDSAINDGRTELFIYYRQLSIELRRDDLTKKILADRQGNYSLFWPHNATQEEQQAMATKALRYAADGTYYHDGYIQFSDAFNAFLCGEFGNKKMLLPPHMYEEADEQLGSFRTHDDIWGLINSQSFGRLALGMMDVRLRSCINEDDIDNLVLDFEAAFLELEGEVDEADADQ